MNFTKKKGRIFLGKKYSSLPKLDLLAIQKDSWRWFLEKGIKDGLQRVSPIEDQSGKRWELVIGDHYLTSPRQTLEEAIAKRQTFAVSVEADISLTYKPTGKTWQKRVYLFDLPQMTEEGTFIINGVERAIVTQITRAPGVYFTQEIDRRTSRALSQAEIRPLHGSWLEMLVDNNDVISLRIDRRRKMPVTLLLKALGMVDEKEIIERFSDYIVPTLNQDSTKSREEALLEIYRQMRPGEPAVIENAEAFLFNALFNPRLYDLSAVGRFKINKRLGLNLPNTPENHVLRKEDIFATLSYLIKVQKGEGELDDIDHLANRYLRSVGQMIAQVPYRVGLARFERMIRERLVLLTEENVNISSLINSQPIIAAINEFFRTNRLSTIIDQTNPLSELDNLRRLSVMGPGGLTRERAPFSIRDISSSQYGRICPVRSPEGQNIGLVTYLALYARVNQYGFLETPYKKLKVVKRGGKERVKITDEIIYLPADDEENYYITSSDVNFDENNYITDPLVPARYHGEFIEIPATRAQLIDVCAQQTVGASASLIPFLDHDEPARALMGSHMECQAVPLVKTEAPVVGTGMERVIPEAMNRVIRARHAGEVVYVDGERVEVKLAPGEKVKEAEEETENIKVQGKKEIYFTKKFMRTSPYGTCYSQRPAVRVGDKVKRGDLIIDGPACDQGELALGKNLVIAYCSFEGLGFEDAIVVSDRLLYDDVFTSITINEYTAEVTETKLGPEELTRDIPNVSEAELANLGPDGIVTIGSFVKSNDILVGKIAPKGETELNAEERLLRAIFGEKAREVRDTSLRLPHGVEGVVIGVDILDKKEDKGANRGINKVVTVKVAQMRKLQVGDKVAGRHGNKGVISKIVPQRDMPYLADGTPVDIIISPLSVLSRMNLGQLLEAHLGWIAQKEGLKVAVPVFEKFDEKILDEGFEKTGLTKEGKVTLYDGRTGEPYKEKTTVGVAYILKLVHMAEDKVHARSTGPYSLVTQQPLGGKAQMGGQRFGEMEVWALEAHRAAHTLQEMLTIKSDDIVGRAKAFEAIVKGLPIPKSKVPESFRVLLAELKSLGLSVKPRGKIKTEEDSDTGDTLDSSEKKEKEAPETLEKK